MKRGILGFVVAVMVFGLSAISSFAATGTVTADTAKIREKASTDSTVVGSTRKGSKIDIVGAEKDGSGMTWYKVPVSGGAYGYVRGDLVETSDNISVTETATTTTATTQEEKPAATVPTAIGEQAATVTCDSNVKVRAGASTKHDVVTSLPNGTEITLIGEANDAAGNKWYQLRCEYNGKSIEGYIRSDLITIGTAAPEAGEGEVTAEGGDQSAEGTEAENPDDMQQEEVPEETYEEPVAEHRDYEVVYTPDAENPDAGKYYLYNNIDGTMADVEVLFQTVTDANTKLADMEASASQKNIVIIILAVVIVLLFGGITFLILRLKNAYEYDYEDEEEEDEEAYEEPVVRRRQRETDGEGRPERIERNVRSEREMRPERRERERDAERSELRERVREQGAERGAERNRVRQDRAEQPERRSVNMPESGVKRAPRKAQNFLTDDDEFEFEFLNMDDKDL